MIDTFSPKYQAFLESSLSACAFYIFWSKPTQPETA